MTPEERELLLKACDKILSATLSMPHEREVASTLKSLLTDREDTIYTQQDAEALCETAVAAYKKGADREGFASLVADIARTVAPPDKDDMDRTFKLTAVRRILEAHAGEIVKEQSNG